MVPDLDFAPHEKCSLRPGYRGTSLQSFYARFPSDEACLRHILDCSTENLSACMKCGKEAKLYRIKGTRRFQYPCGHNIHPMAGTIFSHTGIPLQLWFYAMLHFSNSAEGVNSVFLARHLGIALKAAFRMGHRIRLQMAALESCGVFGSGGGVVDLRLERLGGIRVPGRRKAQTVNVLFLSDGQRVTSAILGNPRRHIINGILKSLVSTRSKCITTCYQTHRASSESGTRSPLVEFEPDFFFEQPGRADLIAGLDGYYRRPLRYNYRRVSRENLWLYLKEFEFRFNRRQMSEQIFWDLVSRFPDSGESAMHALRSRYMKLPLQASRD